MSTNEVKIAKNIEASIFFRIVEFRSEDQWLLMAKYDARVFDKDIYFDFYEKSKSNEKLRLTWNNWFEGEIGAR